MYIIPKVHVWIAILKLNQSEDNISLIDLIQPELEIIDYEPEDKYGGEEYCIYYRGQKLWLNPEDILAIVGD